MANRSCTFIIVPDASSHCKRYNIPKTLLYSIAIISVVLLVVASIVVHMLVSEYSMMAKKMHQVDKLKKISLNQKGMIDRYEQDITLLSSNLSRIKQLNSRLTVLTGMDPAKGENTLGLGGPEEVGTDKSSEESEN